MNWLIGLGYRFLYPKIARSLDSTVQRVFMNPRSTKLGLFWGGIAEGGIAYLKTHGCDLGTMEWFGGLGPALYGAYQTEKDRVIVVNGSGRPETKVVKDDGTLEAAPVTKLAAAMGVTMPESEVHYRPDTGNN